MPPLSLSVSLLALFLRLFLLLGCLCGIEEFVLLFPLHPAVLKPDFDLSLRQAQGVGDLYPAPPGQVAVKVELLLQLQSLVAGVGLSAPAATVAKWT